MEINMLKYFLKVAELQHITKAADECFISQAAMSQAIHSLEEELGVPLFERKGRKITLNRYGCFFVEHAEKVVKQYEEGYRALISFKNKCENTINLYAPTIYGFPGLASEIFQTCNGINVSMCNLHLDEIRLALKTSSVDICISQKDFSYHSEGDRIDSLKLISFPTGVLASANNFWPNKDRVSPYELEQYDFVTFKEGSEVRESFLRECEFYGITPRVSLEVNNYADLTRAISTGKFITLAVSQIAHNYNNFNVRYVPIDGPQFSVPLWINWNNQFEMKPVVSKIKDLCLEYFKNEDNFFLL